MLSGTNRTKAFFYTQDNGLIDIHKKWMNGLEINGDHTSNISDINNNGVIVGYISKNTGNDLNIKHTVVIQDGDKIETLLEDENCISPIINDNNQIILDCSSGVYFYDNGNITALKAPEYGVGIKPFSMNNDGSAIGIRITKNEQNAFIYHDGEFSLLDRIVQENGNNIQGSLKNAYDINDSSQILVGTDVSISDVYVVRINGEDSLKIPPLNPESLMKMSALNNNFQVVGENDGKAFLYSEGESVDLNSVANSYGEYVLTDAGDINDHGVIVGHMSTDEDSKSKAFLAIPVENEFKPTSFIKKITKDNNHFEFEAPRNANAMTVSFRKRKGDVTFNLIKLETGEIFNCLEGGDGIESRSGKKCTIKIDEPQSQFPWRVFIEGEDDSSGILKVSFE